MNPYENILIGHFLYELGYEVGLRNEAIDFVLPNLLQQTPLDQFLGDLLLNGSKCVLIEFKRDESCINTENGKKTDLVNCLQRMDDTLIGLGSACHFLAYGKEESIVFTKYLSKHQSQIWVDKFIEDYLDQQIGLDWEYFYEYIQAVIRCHPDGPDGLNGLTSGLIVGISGGKKIISLRLSDLFAEKKSADTNSRTV